jgi:outer membrane protein assembly factor BamB
MRSIRHSFVRSVGHHCGMSSRQLRRRALVAVVITAAAAAAVVGMLSETSASSTARTSRALRASTAPQAPQAAPSVAITSALPPSPTLPNTSAVTVPAESSPDISLPTVAPTIADPSWREVAPVGATGFLRPGSDPNVLPADLLIADKRNNRLIVVDPQGRLVWQFPRPGDLAIGETFLIPDDAFFSADGKFIVATEEDDFAIRVIDVATHRIVGSYGHPGVYGSGPGYVWNPDDAMMLANGDLVAADIKNCRVIVVSPTAQTVTRQLGITGHCTHHPPSTFGSPNGAFPTADGNYLVTEINGDWVDEIDLTGHVYWTTHPPGVRYPSDTNEIGPDRYLTVDYSSPGQIVVFNQAGQTLWRYAPTGANRLNHPSLALPLPNGDVLLNDDLNDRVIVVDPRTNTVVWQYGHTGVRGVAAGYLNIPDGVDLVPPYSFAAGHTVALGALGGP